MEQGITPLGGGGGGIPRGGVKNPPWGGPPLEKSPKKN